MTSTSDSRLTDLGPVLNETSRKYRRGLLAISLAIIASYFLPDLKPEEASPFGIALGKYAWEFGLLLLLYFGLSYWYFSIASHKEWTERFPTPDGYSFFHLIIYGKVEIPGKGGDENGVLRLKKRNFYDYSYHSEGLASRPGSTRLLTLNEVSYVKLQWRYFRLFDIWTMRFFGGVALTLSIVKLAFKYTVI